MTSATQRIAQYNKEVGQPRGGLMSLKLLTVIQLDDGLGMLDYEGENVRARVVRLAVHHPSRLTDVLVESQDEARQVAESVFRASLVGARRLSDAGLFPAAHQDATQTLRDFTLSTYADGVASIKLDERAVQSACRLASYEITRHAGLAWYDPADTDRFRDATTVSHIMMTERTQDFLREYGPAMAVEFAFAS
ncbi:hypothetical protein ACFSYH_08270 [Populibacterium corticicola]|uniref:Uncharacterized protein n=1 Tax=Populibacterium corticicola TaxID=1812826 RepID=A0ABW5XHL7_9MICO